MYVFVCICCVYYVVVTVCLISAFWRWVLQGHGTNSLKCICLSCMGTCRWLNTLLLPYVCSTALDCLACAGTSYVWTCMRDANLTDLWRAGHTALCWLSGQQRALLLPRLSPHCMLSRGDQCWSPHLRALREWPLQCYQTIIPQHAVHVWKPVWSIHDPLTVKARLAEKHLLHCYKNVLARTTHYEEPNVMFNHSRLCMFNLTYLVGAFLKFYISQ